MLRFKGLSSSPLHWSSPLITDSLGNEYTWFELVTSMFDMKTTKFMFSIIIYTSRALIHLSKHHKECISTSLSWMEREGLKPIQVVAFNSTTKATETLLSFPGVMGENPTADEHGIDIMLCVKDRFDVSIHAYNKLLQLCKQMPITQ